MIISAQISDPTKFRFVLKNRIFGSKKIQIWSDQSLHLCCIYFAFFFVFFCIIQKKCKRNAKTMQISETHEPGTMYGKFRFRKLNPPDAVLSASSLRKRTDFEHFGSRGPPIPTKPKIDETRYHLQKCSKFGDRKIQIQSEHFFNSFVTFL